MAPGAISLSVAAENQHTHSLFQHNLALPEIGCKEAQHSPQHLFALFERQFGTTGITIEETLKKLATSATWSLAIVSQVWEFQSEIKSLDYKTGMAPLPRPFSSDFSFSGTSLRLTMLRNFALMR